MGAKTSIEMEKALELVLNGITPYAAVRILANDGYKITEQAICQRAEYKEYKRSYTHYCSVILK